MIHQRFSSAPRRIWARLCALALIAAMLLTGAYAGGAVEPMENEAVAAAEPRAGVTTVDTLSKGVHINLFDYNTSSVNRLYSGFTFSGGSGQKGDWNNWTGSTNNLPNGVYQGILEAATGNDGYPAFDAKKVNGDRSLNKLFDPAVTITESSAVPCTITDANHLFYMEDGYYAYDSAAHAAYYNPQQGNGGNFQLKDSPIEPQFLPFNDWSKPIRTANFHFGMSMNFQFLQPKGGKVANANGQEKNMIFEFTGDDDVWLFIDGCLILDMGGIHGAIAGSIDFATGKVNVARVYNPVTKKTTSQTTTLAQLMRAAGKESSWLDNNFDKDENGGYTRFKDYTIHTFHYYYLERGKGSSNCKIKFNLPTIPDDTLYVQKKISYTNMPDYLDAKFDFRVTVQEVDPDGNPAVTTDGTPKLVPYQGKYEIYQGEINAPTAMLIKADYTDDGTFTLQHGQFAKLSGERGTGQNQTDCTPVKATSHFVVSETNVYAEHYEVTANEQEATWQSGDGSTKGDYASGLLEVQTAPIVTFKNRVTAEVEEKLARLIIGKKLEAGSTEDAFDIQIKIGGALYANQPYYTLDADGNMGGEALMTDAQGVAKLRANQQICILGIVWGTSFEVNEMNCAQNKYQAPIYTVMGDLQEDSIQTENHAAGRFQEDGLNMEATVTITNTLKTAGFSIQKVDSATGHPLPGAKFELREAIIDGETWSDRENGNIYYPNHTPEALTDQNGVAAFQAIPFGNYLLHETKAPAGYKLPKDPVQVTVEPGMVTLLINGEQNTIPLTEGISSEPNVTIPNKEKDQLPVAGGMGALWFTGGGLVLMGAAALLYGKRRRKGEKE